MFFFKAKLINFSAKGLQSVVQLMGEKDLFDYWSQTYKTHNLGWTQEKAKAILEEWQVKFSEEVRLLVQEEAVSNKYNVDAFSSSQLDGLLHDFSEFSWTRMAVGYLLMVGFHLPQTG